MDHDMIQSDCFSTHNMDIGYGFDLIHQVGVCVMEITT